MLTADEIGDEGNNEFFWISQEGGQVQLCEPADQGGASGLFCETIPVGDLEFYFADEQPDIDLDGADRFEICWPDWNGYQVAVQRTMVIDDTLWTLSFDRLQANDLGSLDRTDAVTL